MTRVRGSRTLKRLDRYIGIPLIALLGLRRRRSMPTRVRRVGLMKTAAIGDTLLLSGLIDDIGDAFPDAELVMITGDDNRGVPALIGSHGRHVVVSPRRFGQSVRALRALDLDVLIDFGSWPRFDAVLAALSGARFTAGFQTSGQHRHGAYDLVVIHSPSHHERDNYTRLVSAMGVTATHFPGIKRPGTLSPADAIPGPYVVLHPWSAGYKRELKEWPVERWVQLSEQLHRRGFRVVVGGGPGNIADAESLTAVIAESGSGAESIAGRYSLSDFADVLASSAAVISVNTGIAHLAGLVGARTISLEGPTPPQRWRPLGPRVRAVITAYPNCGYLNLGFEYDGQRIDCMDGITVDAVLAALDDLLEEDSA